MGLEGDLGGWRAGGGGAGAGAQPPGTSRKEAQRRPESPLSATERTWELAALNGGPWAMVIRSVGSLGIFFFKQKNDTIQ